MSKEERMSDVDEVSVDTEGGWMTLEVVAKACIASDVHLFELGRADRGALPPAAPGSHITLLTPNGLTRRYSVCNRPGETHLYRIAVKREENGLGGSKSLVDGVKAGASLQVSPPLNYFPLLDGAPSYCLIAGGIGITPILSMAQELQARGADFRIIYLAQTPESAAFLEQLQTPELMARATVHHSHGDPARRFDLAAALRDCPPDTHIYCCGPRRLMDSVKELARERPGSSVHFEDFGTSEVSSEHADLPFQVRLGKTGQMLDVPCGKTILGVLREAGVLVPSSCESGTCGACRTKLLSGVADHRDYVLDDDQLDSEIMICVSRAKTALIEIEL